MKKCFRGLALVLALTMLLSTAALAAETESDKATIKDPITGATVVFDSENEDIINVTFTSSQLTAGSQYLVLMVKGGLDDYQITESTILYIDQTAAEDADNDGIPSVSFQVYPSSIQDSVILITGVADGHVVAAIIEAKYILGDLNGDGTIDALDALAILRYSAQLDDLDGTQKNAADINGDNSCDAVDALQILRLCAGLIDSL